MLAHSARPLGIGDFVRLNSGGPKSLIVDLPRPGLVVLAWRLSEQKQPVEQVFPAAAVHRVDPLAPEML